MVECLGDNLGAIQSLGFTPWYGLLNVYCEHFDYRDSSPVGLACVIILISR